MKRTKNFEYETKRMKNDESITFKGKTDASYIEDDDVRLEVTDNERLMEMERENEDLRKRCSRLESIVTQILSNKEEKAPGDKVTDAVKFIGSKAPGNNTRNELVSYGTFYDNYDTKAFYTYSNLKHRTNGVNHALSPIKHDVSTREYKHLIACDNVQNVPGIHRTFSPDENAKQNNISPEEMEKRNEFFRSTYYEEQLKQIRSVRADYAYKNLVKPSLENSSPVGKLSNERSLSPISHYYETYNKEILQNPFSGHFRRENLYEPYIYTRSVQRKLIKTEAKHGYCRHKSNENALLVDKYCHNTKHFEVSEIKKYDSEFFTKLPPKLHIVESQNKNGVTLTWNATSNTDSSLVKSYQLFARELFGQKVGTMKRMGVIDALPLPMSCNVANLKHNIKYKFAVCAVDIYGRFGKMSNFTGKFELKSNELEKYKDEDGYELKIIV